MPVLPSYRNQSIDLYSKLAGFYMRATLTFTRSTLNFLLLSVLCYWLKVLFFYVFRYMYIHLQTQKLVQTCQLWNYRLTSNHAIRYHYNASFDFNAKTGSAAKNKIYQAVIGKYGKGQVNTNRTHVLNFSTINNLKLVNTFFKHKPTHITTWTSPETPRGSRRNSYRNQIDYILVRKHKGIRITQCSIIRRNDDTVVWS